MSGELEAQVRAWVADDVDPTDRAELLTLLERVDSDPGGATLGELESRFAGPLRFGTAGLRGRVEAGPNRINRATVIRATAGLAQHLLAERPEAREEGVVVGRDARNGSQAFQEEVASVLVAQGIKVWWLPAVVPTPVTAFAVRALEAAAGIMVTASHNPPQDNGYKVYWGPFGAQLSSPTDGAIAAAIDAQPGARHVPRRPRTEAGALVQPRPDLLDAYLQAVARVMLVPDAPVAALEVVYTAMHGVGAQPFLKALSQRGFTKVHSVSEQEKPDPAFPTVAFPNPEEAGALDLALAEGARREADLILANDPDADRLAAVVKTSDGWRKLSGNDIGVLLAKHLIEHKDPGEPKRLLVNTIVSSRLLARMAEDCGIRYAEALTGFKNIARVMRGLEETEGLRPLMGYEEALGYAVSPEVRDKDGISAGVMLAEMAALAKAEGQTLIDRLEYIHRTHGLFAGRSRSVVCSGLDGPRRIQAGMAALRAADAEALRALGVREVWDLAAGTRCALGEAPRPDASLRADVLILELESGRAAVRPSGTEPKLKLYLEREVPWPEGEAHEAVRARAEDDLEAVEMGLLRLAGLSGR